MSDYETTRTMLLSFITDNNEIISLIVPNLDQLTIIEDYEYNVAKIIIPIYIEHEILAKGNHVTAVIVLMTDDPTPKKATDLVSLGYYAMRISAKDLTVTETDPLTFQVNNLLENIFDPKIVVNYTRQLRRIQQ